MLRFASLALLLFLAPIYHAAYAQQPAGADTSKTEKTAKIMAELARRNAESGFADGQYQYGILLRSGTYFPKDEAAAVEWLRKAAEQNYPPAETQLGLMYAQGRGVAKDQAVAAQWYKRGAEHGDAGGQFIFGLALMNGDGVPKDEKAGVALLTRGAIQGSYLAQAALGSANLLGRGVKQNPLAAYFWFSLAAKYADQPQDVAKYREIAQKLEKTLPDEDVALSQKAIQAFKPKPEWDGE